MPHLGAMELMIIGSILMLLFGARKLPELGKGLGDAIREFKKAGRELENPPGDHSRQP